MIKRCLLLFVVSLFFRVETAISQSVTDFGDAPEGVLAYPGLGVLGAFPTCMNVGPLNSYIMHQNQFAFFGLLADTEDDGNAGVCPLFNPNNYNQDECFADNDAGLITPPGFTIQGAMGSERVVPCSNQAGPLGFTCQQAFWGPNIDIQITNNDQVNQKYVNVLLDWDQNGAWAGMSTCPTAPAPEHVLVNFPIPAGYIGALSFLGPPAMFIGPNPGYVWARFSITDRAVNSNWDGSGVFDDGETEDYLLEIMIEDELDWGDAPDVPYPTLAVNNGANHQISRGFFLGAALESDPNGQATLLANGDDNDGDPIDDEDGVIFITPLLANNPAQLSVTASQPGMLDAWIDFNNNGNWNDAGEQIFSSQPLVAGVNNLAANVPADAVVGSSFARFRLSRNGGLAATGYAQDGEVEDYPVDIFLAVELTRFDVEAYTDHVRLTWVTQSESENMGFHVYRANANDGRFEQITATIIDGAGNSASEKVYTFEDRNVQAGQTYIYKLSDVNYFGAQTFHNSKTARMASPQHYDLEQNYPNPFNPTTSIRFSVKEAGFVNVNIYNMQGQLVRALIARQMSPGTHSIMWDSKDDQGQAIASGVYLYSLEVNDFRQTRKMNYIR